MQMSMPYDGGLLTVQHAGIVDLDASTIVMLALFLVFFFLYNRIFAGKLVDMFDKRHELTVGSREAADRAVKAAEVKISEYESRIGEVRRKAVDETKRLRADGTQAERQQLDAARTEGNRRVEQGLVELRATADQARANLSIAADKVGDTIATKILGGAA